MHDYESVLTLHQIRTQLHKTLFLIAYLQCFNMFIAVAHSLMSSLLLDLMSSTFIGIIIIPIIGIKAAAAAYPTIEQKKNADVYTENIETKRYN